MQATHPHQNFWGVPPYPQQNPKIFYVHNHKSRCTFDFIHETILTCSLVVLSNSTMKANADFEDFSSIELL